MENGSVTVCGEYTYNALAKVISWVIGKPTPGR